jgi:hypothetical protein
LLSMWLIVKYFGTFKILIIYPTLDFLIAHATI